MESFRERVVAEKDELDGRLTRLGTFMGTSKMFALSPGEQSRLRRQRRLMEELAEVLVERIEAFDLVTE